MIYTGIKVFVLPCFYKDADGEPHFIFKREMI